MSNKIQNQNLT